MDSDFSGVAETNGVLPTAVCNALPVTQVRKVDWSAEQKQDPDLQRVIFLLQEDKRLTNKQRRKESKCVLRLLSLWKQLHIKENVLYRESELPTGEKISRLVVPKHLQQEVLNVTHNHSGHLGCDKTLHIARERYHWVGLSEYVDRFVK